LIYLSLFPRTFGGGSNGKRVVFPRGHQIRTRTITCTSRCININIIPIPCYYFIYNAVAYSTLMFTACGYGATKRHKHHVLDEIQRRPSLYILSLRTWYYVRPSTRGRRMRQSLTWRSSNFSENWAQGVRCAIAVARCV